MSSEKKPTSPALAARPRTLSATQTVLRLLQKKDARLKFREICELGKLTKKQAEDAIAEIRQTHKKLVYAKFDRTFYFDPTPTEFVNQTDLSRELPSRGYLGFISDTHLSSKAERLDLIVEAYRLFAKWGITHVFHCGDMTDGFNQYKGHSKQVTRYGDADQAIRVIKSWPKQPGIKTYVISGNHDVDHNQTGHTRLSLVVNGLDYEGRHYAGRDDIIFLGDYSHTIILPEEVTLHLLHPLGGRAYAKSYKPQQRSAAMSPNERPDIEASGHYHTYCHVLDKGTHFIPLPGLQDKNEYSVRLALESALGIVIAYYEIENMRLEWFGPHVHYFR